jgi:hypothetical protein
MCKTLPRLAIVAAALSMSACGLTPTQQKWVGIAAGVLTVGAIAAHEQDNGKARVPTPSVDCNSNPELCR